MANDTLCDHHSDVSIIYFLIVYLVDAQAGLKFHAKMIFPSLENSWGNSSQCPLLAVMRPLKTAIS